MKEQASHLLQGITVIEMQSVGPVPFASRLMAQLGARVVRVHSPQGHALGQVIAPEFDVLSHGKETQHLDLKSAEGHEAFLALASGAQVLLDGFRPGVLERLQLAPDVLLAQQPKLVIGRLSGWGLQGPWAQRAGHDINYMALTGALLALGNADRPPVPPLNLAADFGGGAMHLLVGVLAALIRASNTGRGGVIESSITAGMHGLTGFFHGMLAAKQWSLVREANWLDGGAPYYCCYATQDAQFVAVGAIESRFFVELLKLTALQGQIDPQDQDNRQQWPRIKHLLAQAFASKTRNAWAELALGCDACVSPVLSFEEARHDQHNQANHWFEPKSLAPVNVIQYRAY
jgi:alpha-methylacyl-CoA racemase